MPSTLGGKLQRLALLAPNYLSDIESLVDLILRRINDRQALVAVAVGLFGGSC